MNCIQCQQIEIKNKSQPVCGVYNAPIPAGSLHLVRRADASGTRCTMPPLAPIPQDDVFSGGADSSPADKP